jgi:hypothetical protein
MQRARPRSPVLFRLRPAVCVLERPSFLLDPKRVTPVLASALSSRPTSNPIDRAPSPRSLLPPPASRSPRGRPSLRRHFSPRLYAPGVVLQSRQRSARSSGFADARAMRMRTRGARDTEASRSRRTHDSQKTRPPSTTLARRTRFAPAAHRTRTRPAPPAHRTRTRRAQTEATRQIEYNKSDVSS